MATTLYLLDTAPDTHLGTDSTTLRSTNVGWNGRALGTARGSGVVNSTATATVTGATPGIEIQIASIVAEWISPPVSAGVTIAGTITLNIWGQENNMSANVAINAYVDVIRANATATRNSNTLARIATSTRVTELGFAGVNAVNNFTVTPTSTVVNRGDRLRVVVFGDDAGTMATGFTFTVGYNGTTNAADGDTFVTFTETFSFESAPAGTQLFLTNVQSGMVYGGSGVPSLVSDFTGSDENPLSEGGNWAKLNSSTNALQRISNAVSGATISGEQASYWTPSNFGPDLEAYLTITTVAVQSAVLARVQGEGGAGTWDGYMVRGGASGIGILRVDNSALTSLISNGAVTTSNGDKIGIRCSGSTIQAWYQASGSSVWNLVCSAVDTTYASAGKIGIYSSGSTTVRMDDFYAGTNTHLFPQDAPALISDFTGADENPLSEGGNWAQLNSSGTALQRSSNTVAATAANTSKSYWTPANFGADVEAYATVSTTSNAAAEVYVRLQGEGGAATFDGYCVSAHNSFFAIRRYDNAAATTLITHSSESVASGDKIGIRCEGSTIQAWKRLSGSSTWNLLLTVVDATYASAGKIGLGLQSTTLRVDDFYAATDSNLFTQQAWTSRGAGVVGYQSDTDAGWVAPLYTQDWYTKQLTAFTLTGLAKANIRALESNASANASMRLEIARVDSDGTNPTVWSTWCIAPTGTDNGELTTSEVARTANCSGDDLSVTDGQRLRFRLYLDDISSAAMGNAFNVQPFLNGTSAAASGDSYVTLAQSVTEFVTATGSLMLPNRNLAVIRR